MTHRIAVLLPCFNEERTIASVVREFRATLPDAAIYVYDNASTDRTATVAREAGAIVRGERLRGKGRVIRRMFADIDADIFVMADGDATYDAAAAPALIARLLDERLDMVVGTRRVVSGQVAYRAGHVLGNRLLTGAVMAIFGQGLTDILSGYRVLSRRFVKSFPVASRGFEIEAEMSVHALSLSIPTGEVDTAYLARPAGSASKLNTYRDGIRILIFITLLFKENRPFRFFFIASLVLAALSLALGIPVILGYFNTGLVPRLPTAVLSASIMLGAMLSFAVGVILDSVSRNRLDQKRLAYLSLPPLRW